MSDHKFITTTQTYLSATNSDLKKTQSLLNYGRAEEEELMPIPDSLVFNNPGLYNQFRNIINYSSSQQKLGWGVSS